MKVVSIVGMPGSGKSEVAAVFEAHGYKRIRFGDITDEEVRKRGLELNEENEREIREELRDKMGKAAYAILNLPGIDSALETSDVVIDGLYSWEEFLYLKEHYGDRLVMVAVWASPETRYARLTGRERRGLTREDAAGRDRAEIENLNKGGPIAMADYTINNESTVEELRKKTEEVIEGMK
jgi:dephospho-CoA kinase